MTAIFCVVIKLDVRKIFKGSTTNADAQSVCGSYCSCLTFGYRQDAASGILPVLNLLTGQKSALSVHMGDSLHRFTWNLAQPRGTWVRLTEQNFTPIGARGWEHGPQMAKISTFW